MNGFVYLMFNGDFGWFCLMYWLVYELRGYFWLWDVDVLSWIWFEVWYGSIGYSWIFVYVLSCWLEMW